MWAGHGNNFEDFGAKDGVLCIGEVKLEDDESKFRLLKVPPNCVDAMRNSFGRSGPVEAEVKLMEVCETRVTTKGFENYEFESIPLGGPMTRLSKYDEMKQSFKT